MITLLSFHLDMVMHYLVSFIKWLMISSLSNERLRWSRDKYLIREIVERGDVKISKIPSADNVADPFYKQLGQSLQ